MNYPSKFYHIFATFVCSYSITSECICSVSPVKAVYDVTLNFKDKQNPTLLGIVNGKKYKADMSIRWVTELKVTIFSLAALTPKSDMRFEFKIYYDRWVWVSKFQHLFCCVLHAVTALSSGVCCVLLWPLTVVSAGAFLWRRFLMMRNSVLTGYTSSTKRRYEAQALFELCFLSSIVIVLFCIWFIALQFISRLCLSRMRYKNTMRRKAVSLAPPSNPNVESGHCWTSCFGLLSCFLRLLILPGTSLSVALPSSSLALWSSSLSVSRCFVHVLS